MAGRNTGARTQAGRGPGGKKTMNAKLMAWLGALALIAMQVALPARADDTEIYQAEVVGAASVRPKVLIVFDDSGSMATNVDQQRPPYDPDGTYNNQFGTDRIYWSTDGSVPPENSSNWFNASQNRCASSYDPLTNNGSFQATAARRWVDSTVIPGDCRFECPDDLTYRRGSEGWGCYDFTTYTEQQEVCIDNWRQVGFNEWLTYPSDRRRFSFGRFGFILEVNDPSCSIEDVEVTDWQYVQERIQICEDDSVVPGTWQALDGAVRNPPHVDCKNDVDTGNPGNGTVGDGYPQNNVATGSEYGATQDTSETLWGNQPYGFYTSHYLDWYYDDSLVQPRPRIDIARDVVANLIATNTGIDFGLMEFNGNQGSSNHGGRIVSRIIEDMTAAQRQNVIDMVNSMTADGATPLCETMYEAYRYMSGGQVLWGDDRRTGDSWPPDDALPRDTLAEDGNGNYIAPITDCAYTYIIFMTDGLPTNDDRANTYIEDLTGETCSDYMHDSGQGMRKNCMPEIAEYLANTDLDSDSSNGNQYALTYTIGFTVDQDLLADTAAAGKGEYYTANTAEELTDAFQGAIYSILSTDTTFTSPAVAVDTFTRTQSRNEVFYAMFKPTERVNWPGNIKKLKLLEDDDGAVLVDANNNPAIDDLTGFIKDTATTFWSSGQDGGSVEVGGAGGRLLLTSPGSRTIYTDTGANQALEAFEVDNFEPADFGVASDAALWALFGSTTEAGYEQQVAWARGYDAYDQDGDGITNEPRRWILGDILHSQPLVVNYGATSGFDQDNPDLRLLVGTNAGFVHMFGASDGDEDWAFTPKALVDLHRQRRQNPLTSDNVYGMDLTPVTYRLDNDQDGTIEPGDGDKVYAYFGMRRGGRSFYALDISNPGSPSFLWSIDPSVSGFAELGQSWSRPVVTFVPGYKDGSGNPKPVLIFGAGYDDRKDAGGVATADTMGRGLFIVDATTGALVWSVTPNANSATNMQETALLHSVAAEVTTVDGNGDGLSDRVYFGDTGGNVWRVDMPGNTLPDSAQDDWYIVKLADVNGGSVATDRRIHNGIDVVRTRLGGQAIDAVIFATGDRTNPNATDVQNRLYMIRDEAVSAYTTAEPTAAECGDEDFEGDFRCSLPVTDAQLYDITDNALADEDQATVISTLSGARGWRLDFTGTGEKGLARTVTLGGKIFATTFTPNDLLSDINICEPLSGSGKLYVVNLFDGDRTLLNLAPVIPDTPSVYFGEDGQLRLLLPPGTPPQDVDGIDCRGGVCEIGQLFRQPYGNYWMQEEF